MLLLLAIIFPRHKALETTGEYRVGAVTYFYTDLDRMETYRDTGKNRTLNVEIYYPENADGTYPLIIFSHGAFGTKSSNKSLCRELASHGYVVASIDHTYQCLYTKDENGRAVWMDRGYMKEILAEDAHADRRQSYEYYRKWMAVRTGDINFVLDYMLKEAQARDAQAVYKLVDGNRIGVMGHSLGGSAALGIGRMRDDVGAAAALESPFMCDIKGVEGGEFVFEEEAYPIPVLNVYSDSSWSHLGEWPQYKENHRLLSDGNKTAVNVHFKGAGHLALTDLALASPFLTQWIDGQKLSADAETMLMDLNLTVLAFFDGYLKA